MDKDHIQYTLLQGGGAYSCQEHNFKPKIYTFGTWWQKWDPWQEIGSSTLGKDHIETYEMYKCRNGILGIGSSTLDKNRIETYKMHKCRNGILGGNRLLHLKQRPY